MRYFVVLIVGVLGFVLVGCGGGTSKDDGRDFYIRSTVEAMYGGKPVAGSAVLFQRYKYIQQNYTRGEATIIELGNGKRVYHVMIDREFTHFYFGVISSVFGREWKKPDGYLPPKKFTEARNSFVIATPVGASGYYDQIRHNDGRLRKKAGNTRPYYRGYPLLVAFRDEADPTSVFLVETEKPTMLFGKRFEYTGLKIERLEKTELTREIHKTLPWVDPLHPFWEGKAFSYLERAERGTTMDEAQLANRVSRTNFVSANRRY